MSQCKHGISLDVPCDQCRQADIDDGIHCESYKSVSDGFDEDGCMKSHGTCMGKYCKDYWPADRDAMLEPMPSDYRPRTRTN